MVKKELSPALVRRLPTYFRTLIRLYGSGKERISSEELARELSLVPSQVRTDIKALGCAGQRSYGYGIPTLYKKIADILQLSDKFSAVIVGATHLALALAQTEVFAKRGVKLSAIFTENGEQVSEALPSCEVKGIEQLRDYCKEAMPSIVLLCGSNESASEVFEYFEGSDLTPEIWNFTDLNLVSEVLTVKNVHLSDCLMLLCFEAGRDL